MFFNRIILLFIFNSSIAFCQQNLIEHWAFGPNSSILDFNSSTGYFSISALQKFPLVGTEGNTTVLDPLSGNILFYTDGISVIDQNYLAMPNGTGLNGHISSSQSGLVCEVPNSCNEYYVFSNNCNYDIHPNNLATGNLFFSRIDLLLPGNGTSNNPSGDIISGQKNILLHSNSSEAMALAIDSVNSAHKWLITYDATANNFLVFEITSSSITQISNYTLPFTYLRPQTICVHDKTGKIAVSSNISNEPVLILNFNSINGTILNHSIIPGTPFSAYTPWAPVYGLEWSASGNKLYMARYRVNATNGPGGQLFQYNLLNATFPPILIFQASNNPAHSISGLKRASNNKIYMIYRNAQTGSANKIAVINQPENSGSGCNFNSSTFLFSTNPGNINRFPEIIIGNPINLNLSNYTTSIPCITSTTHFLNLPDSIFHNTSGSLSFQLIYNGIFNNASLSPSNYTITYPFLAGSTTIDSVQISVCDNRCLQICDTLIVIIVAGNPAQKNYTIDTCFLDSLQLLPQPINTISSTLNWNTGDTTLGIYAFNSGIYSCYIYTGTCVEGFNYEISFSEIADSIIIPNVFSPNNDGKNDFFKIDGLSADGFNLSIFNRWGKLVYNSQNPFDSWNGEINAIEAAQGTYFTVIEYKKKCGNGELIKKQGFITLFR